MGKFLICDSTTPYVFLYDNSTHTKLKKVKQGVHCCYSCILLINLNLDTYKFSEKKYCFYLIIKNYTKLDFYFVVVRKGKQYALKFSINLIFIIEIVDHLAA